MPATFLASDLHLGHRLMAKIRPWGTLEEHDEALIDNWNKTVRPKDLVWVLGDVAMNRSKLPLAGRLNGRKKLVMGNHDTHPIPEYLEYFEEVRGVKVMEWTVLTHIPVHPCQLRRFKTNVHGHMHGHVVMKPEDYYPLGPGEAGMMVPDPRYFNVAMEHINYTPISLDVVREKLNAVQS